jgi:hypothetical protein
VQIAALACWSDEFRLVADANEKGPRWIGPYHVDRFGADPGGGVFFRTGQSMSGAPFQAIPHSTGFALLPNGPAPTATARPAYRHLFGDWYVYEAMGDGPP